VEEIVAAFSAEQVNVDDLAEDDPTALLGKACGDLFTGGVETLRSIIPNERLRALGRVVWDLVGNKRVLTALGPDVPSLSFTCMKLRDVVQGIVLMPKTWPKMVEDDPFMQLGAICFVGVQIVDFYNDRLIGDNGARVRWQAYEAELLHTLQETVPSWTPNEYQRTLLAKYPRGIDSPGVDVYAYRGYQPPQETA
jgi:hypothetical protein